MSLDSIALELYKQFEGYDNKEYKIETSVRNVRVVYQSFVENVVDRFKKVGGYVRNAWDRYKSYMNSEDYKRLKGFIGEKLGGSLDQVVDAYETDLPEGAAGALVSGPDRKAAILYPKDNSLLRRMAGYLGLKGTKEVEQFVNDHETLHTAEKNELRNRVFQWQFYKEMAEKTKGYLRDKYERFREAAAKMANNYAGRKVVPQQAY